MNRINRMPDADSDFSQAWLDEVRDDIGVDLIGVVAVGPDAHPDLKYGVDAFLPNAKAAIVLGMEMASETMNLVKHPLKYLGEPKTGELLSPHVVQVTKEIDQANMELSRMLKRLGYRSIALPSRGLPMRPLAMKAALSYCHLAEAAGMGTIGSHSLLITPEFGTRVRLACQLTEVPLKTTTRRDPVDDCIHCLDCVKFCPVGAISSPRPCDRYEVDGMRCKFYRERVDDCGLCQKVCSFATGHSEATGGPLAAARPLQNAHADGIDDDQ